MARACEALALPIVSGNVSLYNDTDGRSIHPTPVVGCVGLVPDVRRIPSPWQRGRRDPARLGRRSRVCRVGAAGPLRHRLGDAAELDLAAEASARSVTSSMPRRAARSRTTSPSGGLAVALAEAALHSGVGARLDLSLGRGDALRRGLRPGDPRAAARPGRGRPARLGCSASGGSARSAATRSSASRSRDLRRAWEGEH